MKGIIKITFVPFILIAVVYFAIAGVSAPVCLSNSSCEVPVDTNTPVVIPPTDTEVVVDPTKESTYSPTSVSTPKPHKTKVVRGDTAPTRYPSIEGLPDTGGGRPIEQLIAYSLIFFIIGFIFGKVIYWFVHQKRNK